MRKLASMGPVFFPKFDLRLSARRFAFLVLLPFALSLATAMRAQQKPDSSAPPEIIATDDGLLALTTPKGWVRADGPGAAYFVPTDSTQNPPPVCIYISSASIGPKEQAKDIDAYIESDISNFKRQYKNAIVHREQPIPLPQMKLQASVVTFRSGEKNNSFEQVIYLPDTGRVWTLVLSAKEEPAFTNSLDAFHGFAQSYRGTISVPPN